MPVIPALKKLRQKDFEFKANLREKTKKQIDKKHLIHHILRK
jgi:hypothetical protein